MGELIKIIAEWLWKNFLEPVFKRLNQWDVLFLIILSAVGYFGLQWAKYLNFQEKLLWGSALIAAGFIWFLNRKLPSKHLGKALKRKLPFALVKVSLLLFLGGIWVIAAYLVYRIPPFASGVTGFYIARFADDPYDADQDNIATFIGDVIAEKVLRNVQIKKLARRIKSDDQARKLGGEGRAALVLWGTRLRPRPDLYLTFIENRGTVRPPSDNDKPDEQKLGGSRGFSGNITNFGLPTEIQTLQEVLASFLCVYGYYYSQVPDYEKAIACFGDARNILVESLVKPDDRLTPEMEILGATYFYLGNTYLLKGDLEHAEEQYRNAIEATTPMPLKEPQFIEPLNNLGMILVREKKEPEAIDYLEKAEKLCQTGAWAQNPTCPAVSYNIASAYVGKKQYEIAIARFEHAIEQFNAIARNQ